MRNMCEIKAVKVHVNVRTLRQVNGQVHINFKWKAKLKVIGEIIILETRSDRRS